MTAAGPAALLARLGADPALTLAEGALAFAAFHGVAEGGLERRLDQWAEGAGDLGTLTGRLAHLRLEEADPGQLPQVAETGAGSAAALAILWIEVARRTGWTAEALDFPGAVPVRLTAADGSRVVVDPAGGGLELDSAALRALVKAGDGVDAELRPQLFVPMSNRALLLRLQAEIRSAALHGGRIALAVAVVDGMLAFAPDQVSLWREAGMMNLRLERMAAAIAALEQFAARTANCAARRRTQQLLHELRARLP
jgi:regulator of sirC expression with transglutaminase-like and TPR domain